MAYKKWLPTIAIERKNIKQEHEIIKLCFRKIIPTAKMDRKGNILNYRSRSGTIKQRQCGWRSNGNWCSTEMVEVYGKGVWWKITRQRTIRGHSGFQWRTGVTLTTLGKMGGKRVTQ